MFNNQQKEAYSSIKAPDELFERINSSVESNDNSIKIFKTRFSRIAAMAACFVFVAAAVLIAFSGGNVSISVNETALEEDATVILNGGNGSVALAREVGNAEVRISLDLTKDAFISVDSGTFDVVGEEENLTEYSADDDVEIVWKSDGLNKSVMTVDYGRKTCELVLEYDGEWVITRK